MSRIEEQQIMKKELFYSYVGKAKDLLEDIEVTIVTERELLAENHE